MSWSRTLKPFFFLFLSFFFPAQRPFSRFQHTAPLHARHDTMRAPLPESGAEQQPRSGKTVLFGLAAVATLCTLAMYTTGYERHVPSYEAVPAYLFTFFVCGCEKRATNATWPCTGRSRIYRSSKASVAIFVAILPPTRIFKWRAMQSRV